MLQNLFYLCLKWCKMWKFSFIYIYRTCVLTTKTHYKTRKHLKDISNHHNKIKTPIQSKKSKKEKKLQIDNRVSVDLKLFFAHTMSNWLITAPHLLTPTKRWLTSACLLSNHRNTLCTRKRERSVVVYKIERRKGRARAVWEREKRGERRRGAHGLDNVLVKKKKQKTFDKLICVCFYNKTYTPKCWKSLWENIL